MQPIIVILQIKAYSILLIKLIIVILQIKVKIMHLIQVILLVINLIHQTHLILIKPNKIEI